jgi:hypothetical protein
VNCSPVSGLPPLAGHEHIYIVARTQREQTSRSYQSGTVVSGPYRFAISAGEAICDGSVRSFAAGSALVPPSAARSDAVAGSTRWRQSRHPAKPCGSPKGRHHTISRTGAAAAFPSATGRPGKDAPLSFPPAASHARMLQQEGHHPRSAPVSNTRDDYVNRPSLPARG